MNGAKILPKSLDGEHEIDTLCLNSIHKLMEDSASRKKPSLRDICAQKQAQTNHVSQEVKQSNIGPVVGPLVGPLVVVSPTQESLDYYTSQVAPLVGPLVIESLDSTIQVKWAPWWAPW